MPYHEARRSTMDYATARIVHARQAQATAAEQMAYDEQMTTQHNSMPAPARGWGELYETFGDRVDKDQDGAMVDNVFDWAVTGAGPVVGTLVGAGLGGLLGTAVAPVAGTAFGAAVGGAAGGLAGYGLGTVGGGLAHWAGDFIEDTYGLRQSYDNTATSDPSYKKGKPPTWG